MAPRPYDLGLRQAATDQTRSRIVAAARELLSGADGPSRFTVDAVTRQAGVARMTVYYQFKSKRGLLEALFDDLANRSLVPHLAAVFHERTPARALDALIHAFASFWHAERLVLRRARALAALDNEVAESVRARDERRREHLRRIVEPLHGGRKAGPSNSSASTIDVLHMLTSFETFDALLGRDRSFEQATRLVRELAASLLRTSSRQAIR